MDHSKAENLPNGNAVKCDNKYQKNIENHQDPEKSSMLDKKTNFN